MIQQLDYFRTTTARFYGYNSLFSYANQASKPPKIRFSLRIVIKRIILYNLSTSYSSTPSPAGRERAGVRVGASFEFSNPNFSSFSVFTPISDTSTYQHLPQPHPTPTVIYLPSLQIDSDPVQTKRYHPPFSRNLAPDQTKTRLSHRHPSDRNHQYPSLPNSFVFSSKTKC